MVKQLYAGHQANMPPVGVSSDGSTCCQSLSPPTPAPQTGLFPATVPEVFSFLPLVPVDGLRRGMGRGC